MADYIRCCRGEKFFAPTILYPMQQIIANIMNTRKILFRVLILVVFVVLNNFLERKVGAYPVNR
jgi:hypothetical protein